MFFPAIFDSVNPAAAPPSGRVEAICSLYVDASNSRQLFFFEYFAPGADIADIPAATPFACDLVAVDGAGRILCRDFLQMPDRSWRDSVGLRSDELAALLPPELFQFGLVHRLKMEGLDWQGGQPVGKSHV